MIHEVKQELPNMATDFGICIVFKFKHIANAIDCNSINEFGSVIDVSDEHNVKAPSDIVFKLFGKLTVDNDIQLKKVSVGMKVTLFGIVIVSKLIQFLKIHPGLSKYVVSGRAIERRLEQFSKQDW